MPSRLYENFREKVDKGAYEESLSYIKDKTGLLLKNLLERLKDTEDYSTFNKDQKRILEKFLQEYMTSIITEYPDNMKYIRKVYLAGKKLFYIGVPDLFILNTYNILKNLLIQERIKDQNFLFRIETDLLALLRPYTLVSMEIEKKISKLTDDGNVIEKGVLYIDKITRAKKEHILIKNRIVEFILNYRDNLHIKPAEKCEFIKILNEFNFPQDSSAYREIVKIHSNFHEFINYLILNKSTLNSSQKYLLLKEIDRISLKLLYLLNEIQSEMSMNLSLYDSLTQTHNKNVFPLLFQKEVSRSKRYGTSLSIVIIDIDDFKKINDIYGHLVGDAVLKELSSLVRKNLRQSDYIFRFGGEEFILILPHTPISDAYKVAEKIRKKTEEVEFSKNKIRITISCGGAELKNFDNPYIDIEEADKMLYISKSSGKNRCTV